jgi:hypothetical protein
MLPISGYASHSYALSLSEFGNPRILPACKGWVLERGIQGSSYRDATGCYPLFTCQDWTLLKTDLEAINDGIISLVVVTDPLGNYDESFLRKCFTKVNPFKEHYLIELQNWTESVIDAHHRRNARKSLLNVQAEKCEQPGNFLEDWIQLYDTLIKRHSIRGMSSFSPASFKIQFTVPGLIVFRAIHKEVTVGMLLWYVSGEVAYYHLGAYSPAGYELRASFGLFKYAIEHFQQHGLRWLDLGGGAGTSQASAGLTRFKQGWSNSSRPTYLCGRIFDEQKYSELVKIKYIPATDYFPAYRLGEFQ